MFKQDSFCQVTEYKSLGYIQQITKIIKQNSRCDVAQTN